MKPRRFSYLVLVLLLSCGEPVKSVLGEWQWVETSGGLLPPITPENSGQTAKLVLSRDQWTYFENGQQKEQFGIKIKRRSAGLIIYTESYDSDKLINFLNDDEITITYYGGPNSDCQDCALMRFIRYSVD